MTEVLDKENLKRALERVKRNKGAPGIDGMTVDELSAHLKAHWPGIRAHPASAGPSRPTPVGGSLSPPQLRFSARTQRSPGDASRPSHAPTRDTAGWWTLIWRRSSTASRKNWRCNAAPCNLISSCGRELAGWGECVAGAARDDAPVVTHAAMVPIRHNGCQACRLNLLNRRIRDPYVRWCEREGPRGFFLSRLGPCKPSPFLRREAQNVAKADFHSDRSRVPAITRA